MRRGRGQNVEFETVQDEPLPRARDAPQRLHEEPADRLRSARGGRRPERLGQRRHRRVAHELHDPCRRGTRRRGGRLEHLRHQGPQHVLERDETGRAAELVEQHRQVTAAALHRQHHIPRPLGSRDDVHRPHRDGVLGL